jgi:hypothetical protein
VPFQLSAAKLTTFLSLATECTRYNGNIIGLERRNPYQNIQFPPVFLAPSGHMKVKISLLQAVEAHRVARG